MTGRRHRLQRLLNSAEFARAYTLATVAAMFGSFAIQRLTSMATLVTVVLMLGAVGVAILFVRRAELSLLRLVPSTIVIFLALAGASIAWSTDRGESAAGWLALVGFTTLAVAVGNIRDTLQTVRAVGDVLRLLLILSLSVEILSGILIDMPIRFLDVQGNLAMGGAISGIFGTRNMLGFVAMIAIITFAVEWRTRSVPPPIAIPSLGLAGFLALMSASPTVVVLAVTMSAVAAALTIVRRTPAHRRSAVQWLLAGLVTLSLSTAFLLRHQIIAWMDAGSGFSRRADLWNAILDFVQVRPIQGWGWYGPWVRGEYPFTYVNYLLNERHQTALNAYFDTLLQLGAFGLILFLLVGGIAFVRSWLVASTRRSLLYAWTPVVVSALAITSMFESFALTGAGWFLLVLCSLRAGQSRSWRESLDAAQTGSIRTLPPQGRP